MGVPGFFKWLIENYNKDNFVFNKDKINNPELLEKIGSIDWFLIDANCLLHPKCFEILAENPDFKNLLSLENKMMDHAIAYIDKLINYVKPREGVYLAIDGCAPLAKSKQQRSRRFKSIHDNEMWDSIKKKYKKPINKKWNNSAITPGTVFMERLHFKILEWAKTKEIKLIYSSCQTPAEGEHKLLQFIRENIKKNINFNYVMYGLDADLIFLCLSTNADNMFLLREAQEFDKKHSKEELNYVSIDIMRNSIKTSIERIINVGRDEDDFEVIDSKYDNNIINDFILICYFLGNDFLPHLPALDIYEDGLDILLNKYVELLSKYNYKKFLIDRKKTTLKINNKLFIEFISLLASEESENLKNKFLKKRKYYKCKSSDQYDIHVHRVENVMFKVKDPIQLGSDESDLWKVRYYQHYFHLREEESVEFIDTLVYNYLMGLMWTTKYYFDKCCSWSWYYPFNNPPFLEDIMSFFEKNPTFDINKIVFNIDKPLKPFNQLMLVLPSQSSYLVPDALKNLMTNPSSELSFMYPRKIEQDFIGKYRYWMAIPKLPPVDINLLKMVYEKNEKKIKKKDLNRNKKQNPFKFNIN